MTSATDDRLDEARAAFDRHEWSRAYELLCAADSDTQLGPADLERLADAARWSRHFPEMLDAFERAEAAYSASGDRRSAARCALQLTWEHNLRSNDSVSAGKFRHAKTLLADDTDCAEYALLVAFTGMTMMGSGDLDAASKKFGEAIALAQRAGDPDVENFARIHQGHAMVAIGDEAAGLALVDEATAAAMSGALGVQAAGNIYCSTIFLCRNRGDWRRAAEWTDASMRWCERESVAGFPGLCRFHRAEVMRFRGALAEAERDVLEAIDELMAAAPRYAAWAFHELGEIRRRRGDHAGASDAFARAVELGFYPQPGLSRLRLDMGDLVGAHQAIRRSLAEESASVREARGLVLPLAVTIELAAGDLDAAREALAQLEDRARASGTQAFAAAAAGARGEVALFEGRVDEAVRELSSAARAWSEVDAPYEAAEARVLLAAAHLAAGDEADATLELESARGAFERLGAPLDAQRVDALLATPVAEVRAVRTLMFTDIVDSTKLLEILGDAAWENLLAWHDRTLRACFEAHDGEEVKQEGDGFFVAFPDARCAIEGAIAIQRSLSQHRLDHGFAPRVRIGLHTAEVSERSGDFSGRGVNTAARVGSAAAGDEILVTQAALDAAGDGFDARESRELTLKGLSDPVAVASVDWSD